MATEQTTTMCFGERYGVRADWSQAADTVYTLTGDGTWDSTVYQVADFQHDDKVALRTMIERAVIDSGDDPADYATEIDEAIDEAD